MRTCDYGCCPREVRDWFCGAGGAAEGLHRAWPHAHIVGYDIVPQRHYPFHFVLGDAVDAPLDGDAYWASSPCQDHMRTPHQKHGTGWLLDATRQRLMGQRNPWILENVAGAPMRADYVLCGCQFGLMALRRERWFETSWRGSSVFDLSPHDHRQPAISVVGHGTPSWVRKKLGRKPTIHEYRQAMGIDWMNRNELSQAIPPAYSEYIARQLTPSLQAAA